MKTIMTDTKGDPSQDQNAHDAASEGSDANEARSRQRGIGRRLRQMYDTVVHEDVPDDFRNLLEQIDAKSKK